MIIEKTVEKNLGVACLSRIYLKVGHHAFCYMASHSKIIETLAGQNEPDTLDDFLTTFSYQVTATLSVSICKTLKNQVHGLAGEQNKENMPSMVRLRHFSTKSKKCKSPLKQMMKMKACREDNYPIVATFVRAGYRWTPFPFEAFLKGFEASRWSRTNSHKKPMSIWTTRSTSCTSSGLWPSTGQNPRS